MSKMKDLVEDTSKAKTTRADALKASQSQGEFIFVFML